MKLREILSGKNNVWVKEYERYGESLIFVGGCFYNGKSILALDGGFYPIEMKIDAYKWINDETLLIVR